MMLHCVISLVLIYENRDEMFNEIESRTWNSNAEFAFFPTTGWAIEGHHNVGASSRPDSWRHIQDAASEGSLQCSDGVQKLERDDHLPKGLAHIRVEWNISYPS